MDGNPLNMSHYELFNMASNDFEDIEGGLYYVIEVSCEDVNGNTAFASKQILADTNTFIDNEMFSEAVDDYTPVTYVHLTWPIQGLDNLGRIDDELLYYTGHACKNDEQNCGVPVYVNGMRGTTIPFRKTVFEFQTDKDSWCSITSNLYTLNIEVFNTDPSQSGAPSQNHQATLPFGDSYELNNRMFYNGMKYNFTVRCRYQNLDGSYNFSYENYSVNIDYQIPNSSLYIEDNIFIESKWYAPKRENTAVTPYSGTNFQVMRGDNPRKNVTVMLVDFCINSTGTGICRNFDDFQDKVLYQSATVCYRARDFGNLSENINCANVSIDNSPPVLIIEYENITNSQNDYNIYGYAIDFHNVGFVNDNMIIPEKEKSNFISQTDGKKSISKTNTGYIYFDGYDYDNFAYGIYVSETGPGDFFCDKSGIGSCTQDSYVEFRFGKESSTNYYAIRINNTIRSELDVDLQVIGKSAYENFALLSVSGGTPAIKDSFLMDGPLNEFFILLYKNSDGIVNVKIYSGTKTYSGDIKHNLFY